jgi:hypothetical protein
LWKADTIVNPTRDLDAKLTEAGITNRWFDAPLCRNCGAALSTPYCGSCGQKVAKRYRWGDIGKESWERLRVFEIGSLKTLGKLALSPGRLAREYVLGRRTAHMHPLKLLIALVAVLVVMLAVNRYFGIYEISGANADLDRMAKRVIAYANWSFSLGILAVLVASSTVFRGRLGYNFIEHAVLAIFCQNIVLGIIILNLLPTLIWRSPEFMLWHKTASQYYVPIIKIIVVAIAFKQFFIIKLRTEWPHLLLACLVYAGLSWALLRVYALLIFWIVTHSV